MLRIAVAALALLASVEAAAFQPRTGHWFNPAESGSGYNIDIQNGTIVITIFTYKSNGDSEWYLASGKLGASNHTFTATLDKYRNGQCISCTYAAPSTGGNDGPVTVNFTSETSATLTLPGGRVTRIQPFNFGFGDPPQGLLGEWIFAYDILITFADRFTFTTVAPATSGGNGVVVDTRHRAGCELQTRGTLAGTVICAVADAAGNLQNAFQFVFGLDETFSGTYIARSGNEYPMKGFRIRGSDGQSKQFETLDATTEDRVVALKEQAEARANSTAGISTALRRALSEVAGVVTEVTQSERAR
jgi:hypothetical protein